MSEDPTGTPILRGINITEGYIRHTKEIDRFYPKGLSNKIEKFLLEEGDLVIGMDGSKVGKNVAVVNRNNKGSILIQRVARIRAKKNANLKYIYQRIFSKEFQNYVDVVNTSSGIPHISLQQIKDFTISFPSLAEQQKIASFLSLIDDRISTQSKIIEELEAFIQNLSEQLFKRQTRFKDAYGNEFPYWKEKKLGDICEVNPKSTKLPDSFIYIDLESVVKGSLSKTNEIGKDDAPSRAQRLLQRNDILFQMVRPYQKNNFYFDKEGDYVASTGYAQLRTKHNPKFIYYYLHFQKFVDAVIERCTGTSFPAINSTDLSNISIVVPNLSEQNIIADFISLIDRKIETEKKILQQYEIQKEYLLRNMFI